MTPPFRRTAKMADSRPFVVVRELAPLRDSPRGRLCLRVMQGDRGRRLDIREHLDDQNYKGFTKRGVSLSREEVEALFARQDEILRLLDGGAG